MTTPAELRPIRWPAPNFNSLTVRGLRTAAQETVPFWLSNGSVRPTPGDPKKLGMKPPVFVKKGDVMTLGIEGLGDQRQVVVPFKL